MKSLPDLGMSIPSTVGQISHEIPPKFWLKLKRERMWHNVAHHSVL